MIGSNDLIYVKCSWDFINDLDCVFYPNFLSDNFFFFIGHGNKFINDSVNRLLNLNVDVPDYLNFHNSFLDDGYLDHSFDLFDNNLLSLNFNKFLNNLGHFDNLFDDSRHDDNLLDNFFYFNNFRHLNHFFNNSININYNFFDPLNVSRDLYDSLFNILDGLRHFNVVIYAFLYFD